MSEIDSDRIFEDGPIRVANHVRDYNSSSHTRAERLSLHEVEVIGVLGGVTRAQGFLECAPTHVINVECWNKRRYGVGL